VRWAIDGCGTFKAAGEDGIFPGLLQHEIIGHIANIFAACLAYGYIPHTASMEGSRGKFIPKPGRDSYELATSFRPLNLTSFFFKTMERLVDLYIRD
jgi:hypothetical protein